LAELLEVKTDLKILKSPEAVFEAIVDPRKMSRYFISQGSGRMEAGKTIHWVFADVGAELDAKVRKVEEGRLISYQWSASGVEATVTMRLEPAGESATLVRVSESGWPPDSMGIARCIEQSKGWVYFLCCLKAFIEYGIELRRSGPLGGAGKFVKKTARRSSSS
jgi:uncharacterized protein YndB with AHSA1/START domain